MESNLKRKRKKKHMPQSADIYFTPTHKYTCRQDREPENERVFFFPYPSVEVVNHKSALKKNLVNKTLGWCST